MQFLKIVSSELRENKKLTVSNGSDQSNKCGIVTVCQLHLKKYHLTCYMKQKKTVGDLKPCFTFTAYFCAEFSEMWSEKLWSKKQV